MKIPVYVVKLGGNLYIQSEFYGLYPSTTNNIVTANFFDDYHKAVKVAKKARGTVIELLLTDELAGQETSGESNTEPAKEDGFDKVFNRVSGLFRKKGE